MSNCNIPNLRTADVRAQSGSLLLLHALHMVQLVSNQAVTHFLLFWSLLAHLANSNGALAG